MSTHTSTVHRSKTLGSVSSYGSIQLDQTFYLSFAAYILHGLDCQCLHLLFQLDYNDVTLSGTGSVGLLRLWRLIMADRGEISRLQTEKVLRECKWTHRKKDTLWGPLHILSRWPPNIHRHKCKFQAAVVYERTDRNQSPPPYTQPASTTSASVNA